jgi:hypothetical protein
MMRALLLVAATALLASCAVVEADQVTVQPLVEQRYCGAPARNADGSIKRRSDVLTAFQHAHPCPVTGLVTGACPGWSKDHVIPLACGGCDAVSNLQWLPDALKSAPGVLPKDRFERLIYCSPMQTIPQPKGTTP